MAARMTSQPGSEHHTPRDCSNKPVNRSQDIPMNLAGSAAGGRHLATSLHRSHVT